MLDAEIRLAENTESVALGAAILGCLAAGQEATGYASMAEAIRAMARIREDVIYRPDQGNHERYMALYPTYRDLASPVGPVADAMRLLREVE
jgi:ribulose kinase